MTSAVDVISFPGLVDPDNTFTENVAGGGTSATGVFHDCLDYGFVAVVIVASTAANTHKCFIDWSVDGATAAYTEAFTSTGELVRAFDARTRTQYYRIRIYNAGGAAVTFTVTSHLRGPTIDRKKLGQVDGSLAIPFFKDIAAGLGVTVLIPPQGANIAIRVLSYQMSVGTANGNGNFQSSGGTVISMTHRLTTGNTIAIIPRDDVFMFDTLPGEGLSFNVTAGATAVFSFQVQHVFI